LITNISLVAVVGHGMIEKYGVAAKIFTVLANKSINVLMSSMGASEVVTYLIIDKRNRNIAIKEIHNQFFNN
ncbi:MAG: ACT domain-containing protein, partial [Bacteroidales bacterium]|nr:ACT domain-containing protein [Bacteroidales bacterium]